MEASDVFSAGLKYDISSNASLAAGVKDIFNETSGLRMYNETAPGLWYTPDYPKPGRLFYMTLNMVF